MKTCFFVPGVPVPKGSARAIMHKGMRFPVVFQDNAPKQKEWVRAIVLRAKPKFVTPFLGPICIRLGFQMPRLKAHYKASGELKADVPARHIKKPDLDKLVRCVFDSLTGIAWVDDSQVFSIERAYKTYHLTPGVWIEVYEQWDKSALNV